MNSNWTPCTIGDLYDFIGGGTPSKKNKAFWDGDIPWASVKDIKRDYLTGTISSITEAGVKNSATNIAEPEDVILITRIAPGKSTISKIKTAINQDLKILKPKLKIIPAYSHYLFKTLERDIVKISSGTTVLGINLNNLKALPAFYVHPNEQKRIVAKIEELFSELDKGVENLKEAQEQLKIYRQSILKHTFLKLDFSNTIGDLFDFIGGGTPSKKEASYWNGDLPWASVKDLKHDFLDNTIDKISEIGLKNSAANAAQPNDVILITRISPGKTAVSNIRTAINQDLKVIKPKEKMVPLFIHYLFKSLEREIVKLSSGTTVLGINLTNLKSIKIPNVAYAEQQKIVADIEEKFSVISQMEKDIFDNLKRADVLRQAILKKAFSGKLVDQDPNDEPASILLEYIRQEKQQVKPAKRTKKKVSNA